MCISICEGEIYTDNWKHIYTPTYWNNYNRVYESLRVSCHDQGHTDYDSVINGH